MSRIRLSVFAALFFACLAVAPALIAAEPRSGEAIFKAQCASCHGAKGEGVITEYAQPLVGDKSLAELTELIDKTMPEGEPEAVDGVEAQNVAKFVYDSFYSPIAQAARAARRASPDVCSSGCATSPPSRGRQRWTPGSPTPP